MLKFVVYDDEAVFRSKVVKSIDKVMKNTEIEYCKEEYDKYTKNIFSKELVKQNNVSCKY